MTRALIVDDNRALAEDIAEILLAEGYEVLLFSDSQEAAEHASELAFDIALLDVRMPGLDGVALQKQLAKLHDKARFVLMTAYTEDERLAVALSQGVRHVLTKPVRIDELLQTLSALSS